MKSEPINLLQQFGHRYRVELEPGYSTEGLSFGELDPWKMYLPLRQGRVYPHFYGGPYLTAEVPDAKIVLPGGAMFVQYLSAPGIAKFRFLMADWREAFAFLWPYKVIRDDRLGNHAWSNRYAALPRAEQQAIWAPALAN